MTYTELLKSHRDDVARVANTKYFSANRTALRYFHQVVRPAWVTALRGEEEDEIEDRFGLSDTALRIIHLYGRCVHRIGVTRNTPVIRHWPPKYSADGCFMGLSQASIAKLVGVTVKTVEKALRRLKQDDVDGLVGHRLLNVISTDVGVTLDGIFHRQTSFPFLYEVGLYEDAALYAYNHRVQASGFYKRQTAWSREAIQAKTGIHAISDDRVPIVDGEAIGTAE